MRPISQSRAGFTLVELLVVMALMAVLATMTIAFLPNAASSARESRAASDLQGWLNVAKQRALRDRAPRGLRLVVSNVTIAANTLTGVTQCQYIEQPDDFTGGTVQSPSIPIQAIAGAAPTVTVSTGATAHGLQVGESIAITGVLDPNYNGSYTVASTPTANTFTYNTTTTGMTGSGGGSVIPVARIQFNNVDLMNGYYPVDPFNPTSVEMQLWSVQPGDYIEVRGSGLMHRIAFIAYTSGQPMQILVDPPLDFPLTMPTPNYRILRAPRAVGDESLKLPDGTMIDLQTNANFGNPLPLTGGAYVDILFSPSGAVLSRGTTTSSINLWVRAPSQLDLATANDPLKGDPTIVAVFVRTGFVGAFAPDRTPGQPYLLVR